MDVHGEAVLADGRVCRHRGYAGGAAQRIGAFLSSTDKLVECLRESKNVRQCLGVAQSAYANVIKILREKVLVEL